MPNTHKTLTEIKMCIFSARCQGDSSCLTWFIIKIKNKTEIKIRP